MLNSTQVRRRNRRRELLPLASAAAALLPLLAILPSALSLPQPTTSETLEYAPVPPEGDEVTPPAGNFSSLRLGGSSSRLTGGGINEEGAGSELGDLGPGGRGLRPRTKQCVGNPPRQTEDRLSPPCVGFFEGDNFGPTYEGVTPEEIRILIHSSGSTAPYPPGAYVDLGEPEREDETGELRILRTWQRYFNERYQTYGRSVRFVVYPAKGSKPEEARAQASENIERIRPFAAVSRTSSLQAPYLREITRRQLMAFGTRRLPQADYRSSPGFAWGYDPSIEQYTGLAADYICTQIVPYPVSFSGNPTDTGEPRRLGLYHTSDTGKSEFVDTWRNLRSAVEACGGVFIDEQTYPGEGDFGEDPDNTDPEQARSGQIARAIASFRQNGVTTIIWPGFEVGSTQAAAAQQYRPEWVQVAVGNLEANVWSNLQEQSVWRHALLFSDIVRQVRPEDTDCYNAYASTAGDRAHEANDNDPFTDISRACSRELTVYPALRQLFSAIQVAGPRLMPANVERGFRAIPDIASDNPFVPACYYELGDYTCVKDGMVMWWDPTGSQTGASGTTGGCWRVFNEGLRRVRGQWPRHDADQDKRAGQDPCNGVAL